MVIRYAETRPDAVSSLAAAFRPASHRARHPLFSLFLAVMLLALGGCTTLGESQQDYLESGSYGVWQGSLPCADCSGIQARLILWQEPNTFRLTETYLDESGGPKTFTSYGRWELEHVGETPELGRFRLLTTDGERVVFLERLPGGQLRLLDRAGNPVDSDLDYTLQRVRPMDDES